MPDYLKSRIIEKQTLEDVELVLTDKENNYLGPELVLKRCRLTLRTTARCLHIVNNVQVIDCHIEVKKKLANFQSWLAAAVTGCTFTGHLVGHSFGHWPEYGVYCENGSIENCDFSGTFLDGCRFMGCDIGSIKLPKWPCFAILHPHKQRREIESVEWPGKLRFWAVDLPNQPEITAGIVGYAPTLTKQLGCTEEELREALTRLGNVLM